MAEKNALAQILDTIVGGIGKMKENIEANPDNRLGLGKKEDDLYNLPKPATQEFGQGFILWKWIGEFTRIEGVLATNDNNPYGIAKGKYVVNLQLPKTDQCAYSMHDAVAKVVAQTVLSAWNWQHIWKLHAGDFLLASMGAGEAVNDAGGEVAGGEGEVVKAEPSKEVATINPLPKPEYLGDALLFYGDLGPNCGSGSNKNTDDDVDDDECSLLHVEG